MGTSTQGPAKALLNDAVNPIHMRVGSRAARWPGGDIERQSGPGRRIRERMIQHTGQGPGVTCRRPKPESALAHKQLARWRPPRLSTIVSAPGLVEVSERLARQCDRGSCATDANQGAGLGTAMLTTDDIRTIPLFSSLSPTELERLAETSADIHLAAGEFAVPEGGERALYAVLSGKIEVVKTFDGVERRLGWRSAGSIFGEVPLALGSPFPGGYRASQPSRVMRVEPRHYHALAASSPEFATKMGALARERLGGLQAIAAEPPKTRLTMIGHRWDPNCDALRRFLARNQVSFEWLTPDSPQLSAQWPAPMPRPELYPAVRFADGAVLCRPSIREVAGLVGLQTNPRAAQYDTMIIGGGPAGLAAAVYGASEGLRTLVLEREAPGGQAGTSSRIENYLGFPNGVSGDELANRALLQARRLGAEIVVTRSVQSIDPDKLEVVLDGDERVRARTVIIATGVAWRRVAIDGVDGLIGKGVFYGAARSEADATHGLDVHLIGAGNSAGQAALFFASGRSR